MKKKCKWTQSDEWLKNINSSLYHVGILGECDYWYYKLQSFHPPTRFYLLFKECERKALFAVVNFVIYSSVYQRKYTTAHRSIFCLRIKNESGRRRREKVRVPFWIFIKLESFPKISRLSVKVDLCGFKAIDGFYDHKINIQRKKTSHVTYHHHQHHRMPFYGSDIGSSSIATL